MHTSPYTVPNSIDTVLILENRILKRDAMRAFRAAEIFACLQTIDEAMQEVSGKSNTRDAAISTWRELAGDLIHSASAMHYIIPAGYTRPEIDPFSVARKDFPYSGNPMSHCKDLSRLLTIMVSAARCAVGTNQRYTDNYHGVIFYQLYRLDATTVEQCRAFHEQVIRLDMPSSCKRRGLVYSPNYDPDAMPRGTDDHYDISEFEGVPFF
jgi:hypothetical protein